MVNLASDIVLGPVLDHQCATGQPTRVRRYGFLFFGEFILVCIITFYLLFWSLRFLEIFELHFAGNATQGLALPVSAIGILEHCFIDSR